MNEFYGVQSHFGVPIGAPTMQECITRGWGTYRLGIHPDVATMPADLVRSLLEQSIAEVVSYRARPLVLVPPRTMIQGTLVTVPEWVPRGLDVELYGTLPDKPGTGMEPDLLGYSPEAVAAEVDLVMPVCRALGHRVWAPCLANFSKNNIEWIRRFCAALKSEDVGIAAHRYMDYGNRRSSDGRRGFKNRDDEITAFENAIGARAWAITETSWLAGRHMKWQGDVWKALAKIPKLQHLFTYVLTELEVAQNFYDDCKLYRKRGASFVIWYQINDGPDRNNWEECQGLRRFPYEENSWKPIADVPLRNS